MVADVRVSQLTVEIRVLSAIMPPAGGTPVGAGDPTHSIRDSIKLAPLVFVERCDV